MALEQSVHNNIDPDKDKNFDQFEDCCKPKEDCRWKDSYGKCVFETCVVENEDPPVQKLWFYNCIACGERDSIVPYEMKIYLCSNCLKRLQKGEKLPFKCIICGKPQDHPAKGWSTPICDECLDALSNSVNCGMCGN